MKIIFSLKTGFLRAIAAWKAILIYWIISLLLVSMMAVPLKASLKAALGKSMITDKLTDGLNIDVLGDMGPAIHSMASALFAGVFILALVAVVVNVFMTGGIFNAVKNSPVKLTSENFFMSASRNFWPFLIILLLLYLIITVLFLIVVVAPFSMASNSDSVPEGTGFRLIRISGIVFAVLLSILLLVADYARAWQSSQNHNACFRAFGFGFSQTFRTFLSSFPLMLLILILQVLIGFAVFKILAGFTPVTAGGVLLLFIVSQITMFANLFLRVLRYAAVTSLMELNPPYEKVSVPVEAEPAPELSADSI
jgi:hypothetical protein